MELDLNEETSLNKRLELQREKLAYARRFICKIEESKLLSEPLLKEVDEVLRILERQTADIELKRREQALDVKQLDRVGIRDSSKARTSTVGTYERVLARRGEKKRARCLSMLVPWELSVNVTD
jgi:hypothetical protein